MRAPLNTFSLSLDSDQKDQLIEVIEKLLADKTTVRIGPHRDGWWKGVRQRPFCPSCSCALASVASPAGGGQRGDGL